MATPDKPEKTSKSKKLRSRLTAGRSDKTPEVDDTASAADHEEYRPTVRENMAESNVSFGERWVWWKGAEP